MNIMAGWWKLVVVGVESGRGGRKGGGEWGEGGGELSGRVDVKAQDKIGTMG